MVDAHPLRAAKSTNWATATLKISITKKGRADSNEFYSRGIIEVHVIMI